MKSIGMKIALAAILIAVGTLGLNAQQGRGINGMGCGNVSSLLTEEQKAILDEMRVEFQAAMDILRADLQAAATLADKKAVLELMKAAREEHIAAVRAQLTEWGYTVNVGQGHDGNNGKHRRGGRRG